MASVNPERLQMTPTPADSARPGLRATTTMDVSGPLQTTPNESERILTTPNDSERLRMTPYAKILSYRFLEVLQILIEKQKIVQCFNSDQI